MDNYIRITSAAVSDRGLSEKRPQNEDSFLEMGQCGIFAVADGVGGAQAGEVASQMAMEIVGEAFSNFHEGADAATVLQTAIERANAAIHQMANELPQLSSMATTIVALHVAGNIATIGHVGDSRLYRVDRDGNLFRETEDHSMVAEEVRAGRMTEEQAENHPSRNIISRALGAEPTVHAEIKTIMVDPGTSFLICSDGITRHVGDQEIKGVLTFGGNPVDICEYLKGLCYERGAEDNLTAVVVKVTGTATGACETAAEFTFIDEDEPTVATPRSPSEITVNDEENEPDLLELDTHEIAIPEIREEAAPDPEEADAPTEAFIAIEPETEPEPEYVAESETVSTIDEHSQDTIKSDTFSMFGDSGDPEVESSKPSVLGKIASAVGLIVVGAAIGLGVYHFALVPKPTEQSQPQLSEMKAANIPLSAFEENRRGVDKDPAAYIAKFGADPRDVDDYYLLGRAYMLSGDFVKARAALTEARNRLSEAEPSNAKVLASDIAIAMVVMNNTTAQTMLAKELEPPKFATASNTNSNTNSNSKANPTSNR